MFVTRATSGDDKMTKRGIVSKKLYILSTKTDFVGRYKCWSVANKLRQLAKGLSGWNTPSPPPSHVVWWRGSGLGMAASPHVTSESDYELYYNQSIAINYNQSIAINHNHYDHHDESKLTIRFNSNLRGNFLHVFILIW